MPLGVFKFEQAPPGLPVHIAGVRGNIERRADPDRWLGIFPGLCSGIIPDPGLALTLKHSGGCRIITGRIDDQRLFVIIPL